MNDKFIFLVRHGEAEESCGNTNDFSRKLSFAGKKQIDLLYKHLWGINIVPEQIVSSCAIRAMETTDLLAANFAINSSSIKHIKNLYRGYLEDYLEAVKATDHIIQQLMIVGHNPTISDFARYLVGESVGYLQPGGVIGIKLEKLDFWKDLYNNKNTLLFVKNFSHDNVI